MSTFPLHCFDFPVGYLLLFCLVDGPAKWSVLIRQAPTCGHHLTEQTQRTSVPTGIEIKDIGKAFVVQLKEELIILCFGVNGESDVLNGIFRVVIHQHLALVRHPMIQGIHGQDRRTPSISVQILKKEQVVQSIRIVSDCRSAW
jgi:hypothetical protein